MLAGAIEALLRVAYFLHTLVADLREPLFEWLGFGRRHRQDKSQELFGVGHIGIAQFAVFGTHFQLSDFFGQLTALLLQFGFQIIPVLARPVGTRKCLNDIYDREIPFLIFLAPCRADLFGLKKLDAGCFIRDRSQNWWLLLFFPPVQFFFEFNKELLFGWQVKLVFASKYMAIVFRQ